MMCSKPIELPCLRNGKTTFKTLVGLNEAHLNGIIIKRITTRKGVGAFVRSWDKPYDEVLSKLGQVHDATSFEERLKFGNYTRHCFLSDRVLCQTLGEADVKFKDLFEAGLQVRTYVINPKYLINIDNIQGVYDRRKAKLLYIYERKKIT